MPCGYGRTGGRTDFRRHQSHDEPARTVEVDKFEMELNTAKNPQASPARPARTQHKHRLCLCTLAAAQGHLGVCQVYPWSALQPASPSKTRLTNGAMPKVK
eukprot:6262418-Amphidinium_carterae.1